MILHSPHTIVTFLSMAIFDLSYFPHHGAAATNISPRPHDCVVEQLGDRRITTSRTRPLAVPPPRYRKPVADRSGPSPMRIRAVEWGTFLPVKAKYDTTINLYGYDDDDVRRGNEGV